MTNSPFTSGIRAVSAGALLFGLAVVGLSVATAGPSSSPNTAPGEMNSATMSADPARGSQHELIADEVKRLREAVAQATVPDEVKQRFSRVLAGLDNIDKALARGRYDMALRELGQRGVILEGFLWSQAAGETVGDDRAAFDKLWREKKTIVNEAAEMLTGDALDGTSMVARALAQAALIQVRAYYHGGKAFADLDDSGGGLFYVGRAHGLVEYARLCARIPAVENSTAPPLPHMQSRLQELESTVRQEYADPERAVEKHSQFISLNASLKQLRELDSGDHRPGSLSVWLEAVLRNALLENGRAEKRKALKAAHASWSERLANSEIDHGIGRMFVEMAARDLDPADSDSDPADLKQATAVLRRVLPAYLDAVGAGDTPVMAQQTGPAKAPLTVTLVRWPYT